MTTDSRTRADMCPGVWRPWKADDGLLIRIRLIGGRLETAALQRLSEIAQRYGDSGIYLTRRANLQIRGLPGNGRGLTDEVAAAIESTGLMPTRTHELVRNVLASPQTGLAGGRADLRPVLARLDALLCAEPRLALLPGRFLFTLDDGRGDLLKRLTGTGTRSTDLGCAALDKKAVQVRVGAHWGEVTPLADVADRLVDLAVRFLDARGTGVDAPWHIRELDGPLQPSVPADSRIPAAAAPLAYGTVPGGTHVPAEDGVVTPDLVRSLLESASDASYVIVTPWRGILVPNTPEVSE